MDHPEWRDAFEAAATPMRDDAWRARVAEAMHHITGARYTTAWTCPPSEVFALRHHTCPRALDYVTETVLEQYMPRIEGSDYAWHRHHPKHGLLYPMPDSDDPLVVDMRKNLLDPIGIDGMLSALVLGDGPVLLGTLVIASERPTAWLIERFGAPLVALAEVCGKTLNAAIALARGCAARASAGTKKLTDRERQVAELVADGLTNLNVASRLSIAEDTVHVHLKNIYAKVGVRSRTDLTRWFWTGRTEPRA